MVTRQKKASLPASAKNKKGRNASTVAEHDTSPPKRRRLANTIFDMVEDKDVDVDEVAGGLVRMLEYEHNNGLVEALNFLAKSAGLSTSVQLLSPPAAVRDLERANEEAPKAYPLMKRSFAGRFTHFVRAFVLKLNESDCLFTQESLLGYLRALAKTRIRALRLCSILFLCRFMETVAEIKSEQEAAMKHSHRLPRLRAGMEETAESIDRLEALCLPTIRDRATDCAAEIRVVSLQALAQADQGADLLASLNDLSADVRITALTGMAHVAKRNNSFVREIADDDWRSAHFVRIVQIAEEDADDKARAAALRLLATLAGMIEERDSLTAFEDSLGDTMRYVSDSNELVASSSVQLLVALSQNFCIQQQPQASTSASELWPQLVYCAKAGPTVEVAEAIQRATDFDVASVFQLLRHDFSKPTSKKWIADLGFTSELVAPAFNLAIGFAKEQWTRIEKCKSFEEKSRRETEFVSSLLQSIPHLLSRFEFNDNHVGLVVSLASVLDLTVVGRLGFDAELENVMKDFSDLLNTRTSPLILFPLQNFFEKIMDEETSIYYNEGRRLLNTVLTSVFEKSENTVTEASAAALLFLARWLDVTDMGCLPIWSSSSPAMLQLVEVLGLKGDSGTVDRCISHLQKCEPTPVDALIRLHVAARMRNMKVPPPQQELVAKCRDPNLLKAFQATELVL